MLLTTTIPGPGLEFSPSLGTERRLEAGLPRGSQAPHTVGRWPCVLWWQKGQEGLGGSSQLRKGLEEKAQTRGRKGDLWEEEQLGWVLISCD